MILRIIPDKRVPSIMGIACRISFSTPEGEVKVLQPVKFIA